ncbi:hypothetical protein JTE90_009771 [Oedothorax gibbosus]|uniref:Uncharacterized protein n=1 Tax=Oedothorax gibbosus TaxID=931172 RepID=A0AAV6V7N1_9ARAC|nr:hypothetical protein JTE90_009771 [Oedothorax gibbosus]
MSPNTLTNTPITHETKCRWKARLTSQEEHEDAAEFKFGRRIGKLGQSRPHQGQHYKHPSVTRDFGTVPGSLGRIKVDSSEIWGQVGVECLSGNSICLLVIVCGAWLQFWR